MPSAADLHELFTQRPEDLAASADPYLASAPAMDPELLGGVRAWALARKRGEVRAGWSAAQAAGRILLHTHTHTCAVAAAAALKPRGPIAALTGAPVRALRAVQVNLLDAMTRFSEVDVSTLEAAFRSMVEGMRGFWPQPDGGT